MLELRGEPLNDLKPCTMLVPVEPSNVLLKALKDAKEQNLVIRQASSSDKQYVFECGEMKIVCAGFVPPNDWALVSLLCLFQFNVLKTTLELSY